ncbi:MAG TPA: holo-ACP synthase [Deltaproteobacteria bacterium]|nr:holo-ACP synthase [Deltaproteobacteria bacterium]
MIRGIGIDLVAIDRMAALLERFGERFERRIFTREEIAACARRRDRSSFLAGRFAAKEAFLKALGTGLTGGISFKEITVVRNRAQPQITVSGKALITAQELRVSRIHLSISHEKRHAVAVVILEGD